MKKYKDLPRHLQLALTKGAELLQCPVELVYQELFEHALGDAFDALKKVKEFQETYDLPSNQNLRLFEFPDRGIRYYFQISNSGRISVIDCYDIRSIASVLGET